MTSDDTRYQHWLAERRRDRPDPDLTDRVMAAVARADIRQRASLVVRLVTWIDRSRWRCLAACVGALLVGSLPFAYVAYVSQAFVF